MVLTEKALRNMIRSQIRALHEGPNDSPPSTGKDIKGGAAADKAGEKVTSNSTIKKAIDQITTADGLASFIQDVIEAASEKGIDKNEIKTALKKLSAAVAAAK
jgi:hypothetical protein